MSEKNNGNTGWQEVGGEVVPPEGEVTQLPQQPYINDAELRYTHTEFAATPPPESQDNVIGIQNVPGTPEERKAARVRHPSEPSRKLELPGGNKGRRNPGSQLPTPNQVQWGKTNSEIDAQAAINREAAAAARNKLNGKTSE